MLGVGIGAARPGLIDPIGPLFAAGQQGLRLDSLSNFAALFQDSARTTPVTLVEQTVGSATDTSGRGNNLIQATAGSRPLVSARLNQYSKTQDLTDAFWVKTACTISGTPVLAADGTLSAQTLVSSAATALMFLTGTRPAAVSGIQTMSVYAKDNGARYLQLLWTGVSSADYANFDLVAGTVPGGIFLAASITNEGNGWYRCSLTSTLAAAGTTSFLTLAPSGASARSPAFVGDGVQGLHLWQPQCAYGAGSRYQRVNTSTDYDTTFPFYLSHDGVDDNLTSAAGGGGAAGFFFCQAIRPTGGLGLVRTIWSDAGINTGYSVQINATNQLQLSAGNGTLLTTIATAAATVVGTTHLLTAWDDGTNLNVQLDSGAVASVARPVVVAGTAGFTLSKDNGAATGFTSAQAFAEVYRTGTPVSASERAAIQAYIRGQSGL